MGAVAERLAAAGLDLPQAPAAVGDYVPAVRAGEMVFTSGQLPIVHGALLTSGVVGAEVPMDAAASCARLSALNALAAATTVCDLDDVAVAVRLVCYVASAPGFTEQPVVANAASAVLTTAFGELGPHAREAVGVVALPLGAPVEVSLVLALR
ncbi:MAG: RidA family protein [Coriobacteriales bacterium]|nr:RidA family protein [Coriobacteriales bacterium]